MTGIGWRPDWPAPTGVRALMTTRAGGVSAGPWGLPGGRAGGLNLATHCGDEPAAVGLNRRRLRACLPAEPAWLHQVHGAVVADLHARSEAGEPAADASVASRPGVVCAVLVADCLPVLMAAGDASAVAAVHAGWRGLAGGVIEAAAAALRARAADGRRIVAWLGPCIGPAAFEVGAEVREQLCDGDGHCAPMFKQAPARGKWLADLPALARRRLARAGVASVCGGHWCTVADPARFYSFRRDGVTGRMAACVWIEPPAAGSLLAASPLGSGPSG